jgi:hypothetical protein
MWQYKIHVEIEKTSFQLVHLLRGDELPRQHGAQDLCVRFVLKQRGRPNHAQVFTRVVNRQKATSLLAWQINKKHPSEAQPYMAEASSSSSTSSSERSSTSDKAEAGSGNPRKRLPIVDSINLPRIIATAEALLTSTPFFFFSSMPTSRTPQSAAKAKKAAAVAALKKTRAQTVAASGEATKGLETPARAEEVGSVPEPRAGAGSSREADPGGGSHTTSSSATGSQPPKPPEGGGDPGGGTAEVRKGVKPSQRVLQNANRLERRELTRRHLQRKREAHQIQWSINNTRQGVR